MIAITLDLEWAPEPVLADTLEIINASNIDVTLFSTHDDSLRCQTHERAIHPNFTDSESTDDVLEQLCSLYPGATGVRSHRMFIHTKLRNKFVEYGLEYESNYMAYKVHNIVPFEMPEGTAQFPVYWMDDIWFREDGADTSIPELLAGDGLKVFDFHPPHIAFNTPSETFYLENKDRFWADDPNLHEQRYDGFGVRTIFQDLLKYIDDNGLETWTLSDVYTKFKNNR